MLPRLKINKEILYQATTTGFLNATDLADYLVTKGMTFRESHSCVGKAVGYASSRKNELHELTLEEMKSFSTLIAEDIFGILTPEQMINRRTSFGGTAQENVKAAIRAARQRLSEAVCP
jgi:argininosuccinate lyase